MAIRSLIGIATLIAFVFVYSHQARADDSCFSRESFIEALNSPDVVLMMASAGATKKIVETLNKNRRNVNMPQVDGRSVIIGLIKDEVGNVSVGVAVFDANACVIPDTVANVPIDKFAIFLSQAGVSVDDFAKIQGS